MTRTLPKPLTPTRYKNICYPWSKTFQRPTSYLKTNTGTIPPPPPAQPTEADTHEASIADRVLEEFLAHENLKDATVPLATPDNAFVTEVHKLKLELDRVSQQLDKHQKSVARLDQKPDFVHKGLRVKGVFHVPKNAKNFPLMQPFYDRVTNNMTQLNHVYQKLGTHIIAAGQRLITFQIRLQRVQVLADTLIEKVGWYHIMEHRHLNKHKHALPENYVHKSKEELTAWALRQILLAAPTPLLECLDFNKKALLFHFETLYPMIKPENFTGLNLLDRQSVEHARLMMAGYIAHITWIPYDARIQKEREQAAHIAIQAARERQIAKAATAMTQEIVNAQAASLPKTPKTLRDAIDDQIMARQKGHNKPNTQHKGKHHLSRTSHRPTKRHKPNPKGPGGESPTPQARNTGNTHRTNRNNPRTNQTPRPKKEPEIGRAHV